MQKCQSRTEMINGAQLGAHTDAISCPQTSPHFSLSEKVQLEDMCQ